MSRCCPVSEMWWMSFHRMQVLHRSSWLPLGRCGPPFVFKPFNMWSAHLLGCDFLKCKSFWMCVHVMQPACMRELLGQFIHRDGGPEGLFNILLLPWTLNGVAHGCEVLFLVADLFFFLFWSLCFAFLTDISGFVKTIICFSQPFSGPSILGWRSSTQPSWHTGVSQCIDIWLGLCSICTALHGVHWDVQTAWTTQPACTSSAGLFPKRGRKAMALTSKHRVRSFFFQFFLTVKLNGDAWKVCNRFSTPQAISCWAWTCAGTFGACKIPFSAKGSPLRSWRWQRTAAWNWQSITLPFCTFAASLVDQMKCCPTSESEYRLAILPLLCSCNVRRRKFELTRQAAQLVQSRTLAPGTHQFCAPLPGLQPPFNQSLWLTTEQVFISICLVPAETSNKSFVTETMVLKAWLTKRQRQVTSMWFIKIVFEISLTGRSIEGWFLSCTNALGSTKRYPLDGLGTRGRLHFLCGWLHFCHSTTIQHFLFSAWMKMFETQELFEDHSDFCASCCHSKDRAICSKNLPLVLKLLRRADAVRRPFELHLARVIEWPASLNKPSTLVWAEWEIMIPAADRLRRKFGLWPTSSAIQCSMSGSSVRVHGWGLQAQGSRLWAGPLFVWEVRQAWQLFLPVLFEGLLSMLKSFLAA